MKRFADRLREARTAVGLTQEQLGFSIGVSKSSISAWETGKETPSFKFLPELRSTLKRSLDELICDGIALTDEGRSAVRDDAIAVRDQKERILLQRYRSLSAKRKQALIELLRPFSDRER